ncbi:MAG TPA: hypothetical protein VGG09_06960 [Acidimicrobiales bacterium]|jgi:hypothetical protein
MPEVEVVSGSFDGVDEDDSTDPGLTDEELTALALAADPDAPISADAIPLAVHLSQFAAPLPLWYMPPIARSTSGRWKMPVVLAVVAAFLLIDALGLCNTYGVLNFA